MMHGAASGCSFASATKNLCKVMHIGMAAPRSTSLVHSSMTMGRWGLASRTSSALARFALCFSPSESTWKGFSQSGTLFKPTRPSNLLPVSMDWKASTRALPSSQVHEAPSTFKQMASKSASPLSQFDLVIFPNSFLSKVVLPLPDSPMMRRVLNSPDINSSGISPRPAHAGASVMPAACNCSATVMCQVGRLAKAKSSSCCMLSASKVTSASGGKRAIGGLQVPLLTRTLGLAPLSSR
mmetsp:Transcript_25167/g.58457  ORF Transcript_25167/g.58457 Transcript_25167/m.58457 type:complete len:239 (-) Transcript_25167:499-1215(-)